MSGLRVVIDTNVHISALINPSGTPARTVSFVIDRCDMLLSDDVAHEYFLKLHHPKIARLFGNNEAWKIAEYLNLIAEGSLPVESLMSPAGRVRASRDPDDDKFLELALCGDAHFIITGDRNLLTLDPFRGIRIVSPADFLVLMEAP